MRESRCCIKRHCEIGCVWRGIGCKGIKKIYAINAVIVKPVMSVDLLTLLRLGPLPPLCNDTLYSKEHSLKSLPR